MPLFPSPLATTALCIGRGNNAQNTTCKPRTSPRLDKNELRLPLIACKRLFIPLQAMFHFRLPLGEKGCLIS